MNKKIRTIGFIALFALAVGWAFMWYIRKTVVPEMKFQSAELLLTDGITHTNIKALKGKVAIVSFFQTWCGPCIGEMTVFEQLQSTVNSPGFSILCISDEEMEKITSLQNRFSPGKILFTQSGKSLSSMGIHVYPTTYLLNKRGEVIKSKLEGYNWELEKETIQKLLNE